MTVVKIKQKKTQENVSYKETLNWNIIENFFVAIQLDNKIEYLRKRN